MAQQAGFAIADEHVALDADDGGDVRAPVGCVKLVAGIEDGDGTAFVTVAASIVAMGTPARGGGGGDFLNLSVQGEHQDLWGTHAGSGLTGTASIVVGEPRIVPARWHPTDPDAPLFLGRASESDDLLS